jgi:hypothetical protein
MTNASRSSTESIASRSDGVEEDSLGPLEIVAELVDQNSLHARTRLACEMRKNRIEKGIPNLSKIRFLQIVASRPDPPR